MAASRSVLEALLARVQKRAQEPRPGNIHIPPLPVPDVAEAHDAVDTLPPQPAPQVTSAQPPPLHPPSSRSPELQLAEVDDDEDIEEYDEELIEIIDDADVIPQAAAAARAIEPSAFGANLERRGAPNGKSSMPVAAAPAVSPPAGASAPAAPRAASAPAASPAVAVAEPLRPEVVAARPVAPSPVVHTRGARRDLRATPFLELLDAALKLGA